MCNVTLKQYPCWTLIYGPVVSCLYRLPSTTLQNSTPKLAGRNPENISHGALQLEILARTSRCQAFEKLLWKPSEDASQKSSWNQMSLPIYQGHQTPSAQFLQSLIGSDCGCIVRDLETIIVLVLLAFNFISRKSQHLLTFAEVTVVGLSICHCNAWWWHNHCLMKKIYGLATWIKLILVISMPRP